LLSMGKVKSKQMRKGGPGPGLIGQSYLFVTSQNVMSLLQNFPNI
jgi:hypothetical protein